MSDNELIVVGDIKNVLKVFSEKDGLKIYVEEARAIVLGFEHDLDTEMGRDKTKALSAKVSKLKTKLDGMGKDLVSEWKTKAKAVDVNRKEMRDELDDLKVIARKPLTDWEAKAKIAAAEKFNREQAEKLAEEKESDHEFALLLDDKITRDAAAELERRRQVQVDRENEQAAQAKAARKVLEENARLKAEKDAKDAIAKAARDKVDADKRAKAAEKRREEAEIKARADAVVAEERRVADVEAAAEKAKQDQIKAQAVKDAAELRATEKREANKRNTGKIRREAKESLMDIGFAETDAKNIVLAINAGKIANVLIRY